MHTTHNKVQIIPNKKQQAKNKIGNERRALANETVWTKVTNSNLIYTTHLQATTKKKKKMLAEWE